MIQGTNNPFSCGPAISDPTKLDKVTTLGVERVYTINPDGTQGTKPTSELIVNNNLVFKDLSNGSNVGNNPNFVERYTYGCLIPANTIKAGDVVNIECSFDYVSGGSAEAYPIIAINTINGIAGWTVIGRFLTNNGYKNVRMQRTLSVKTATNTEFSYSGTQTNPTAFGQSLFTYGGNIDWSINQYIVLGIALNGATDAVWRKSTIIITKN